VERSGWNIPPVFDVIAKLGAVARDEMYRVFNMGIGLILVVPPDAADVVMRRAIALGAPAYRIGRILSAKDGEPLVEYVE
jgi:phosphoribosylformylglycinamidine cyclo-ligase